jgi:hypothetical protein
MIGKVGFARRACWTTCPPSNPSGLRQLDIERWGALPLSTSSAWAQFSKVVVSPKE